MLLRLHTVITPNSCLLTPTKTHVWVCRWVGGWSLCVLLMSLCGGWLCACWPLLCVCVCDVCTDVWVGVLCALAAYLHTLLTQFLWSQLDVEGNPMSASLPLQAQTCVCAPFVCACVCLCKAFLMPQWINHAVWTPSAKVSLSEGWKEQKDFETQQSV